MAAAVLRAVAASPLQPYGTSAAQLLVTEHTAVCSWPAQAGSEAHVYVLTAGSTLLAVWLPPAQPGGGAP